MIGLYIHVPFCISKCPYCDFYSLPLQTEEQLDRYTAAVCDRLTAARRQTDQNADTLYFGGGTPSLLGGKRLSRILRHARELFALKEAEITLEANPAEELYETFAAFAQAGGNRVSMGMQAATAEGLHRLGRRHTPSDLDKAVRDLQKAGLHNLSLDIMLATPSQTPSDVDAAVKACVHYDATHVSAYLLKIEQGTPFSESVDTLGLPDDDAAASLYLRAGELLETAGYAQYEISNFAKPGYASRHNLKYWNAEEYIGIGPAAHSFLNGKRWYCERSLAAFLDGAPPKAEDPDAVIADGSREEYAMLRLRLTEGLSASAFEARFASPLPDRWIAHAAALPQTLVQTNGRAIRLTREGFLLSGTLIPRILWG